MQPWNWEWELLSPVQVPQKAEMFWFKGPTHHRAPPSFQPPPGRGRGGGEGAGRPPTRPGRALASLTLQTPDWQSPRKRAVSPSPDLSPLPVAGSPRGPCFPSWGDGAQAASTSRSPGRKGKALRWSGRKVGAVSANPGGPRVVGRVDCLNLKRELMS